METPEEKERLRLTALLKRFKQRYPHIYNNTHKLDLEEVFDELYDSQDHGFTRNELDDIELMLTAK